jgi:hypothetical protein
VGGGHCPICIADAVAGGREGRSLGPKPLSRRKRRLPVIERPKSAPLSGEATVAGTGQVHDICDFSGSQLGGIKTVIKIPPGQQEPASSSQSLVDMVGHPLLAASSSVDSSRSAESGSRQGERLLPEIPRLSEDPLLQEEGPR